MASAISLPIPVSGMKCKKHSFSRRPGKPFSRSLLWAANTKGSRRNRLDDNWLGRPSASVITAASSCPVITLFCKAADNPVSISNSARAASRFAASRKAGSNRTAAVAVRQALDACNTQPVRCPRGLQACQQGCTGAHRILGNLVPGTAFDADQQVSGRQIFCSHTALPSRSGTGCADGWCRDHPDTGTPRPVSSRALAGLPACGSRGVPRRLPCLPGVSPVAAEHPFRSRSRGRLR